MPQVRRIRTLLFSLLFMMAAAAGCGDPNSQTIFDSNSGRHVDNWMPIHGSSYTAYDGRCNECHGVRLQGGVSGLGCFTEPSCHSGVTSCGTCHGTPPTGGAFPNAAGAHAIHLSFAGISFVCNTCHSGGGSSTPANHMNYSVEANFAIAAYNARTGTAAYVQSSNTCSKVSCHGGQTTPNWTTGSINVDTQCNVCHVYGTVVGSPEYNSFYSGEHNKHVNQEEVGCTVCHDTVKLAVNHFTNLTSTAMEGPASATMRNALNYSGGSCNPSAGGLSGCHGGENW